MLKYSKQMKLSRMHFSLRNNGQKFRIFVKVFLYPTSFLVDINKFRYYKFIEYRILQKVIA